MIPRLKANLGFVELLQAWRPGRAVDVSLFETAFAAEMGTSRSVDVSGFRDRDKVRVTTDLADSPEPARA
jgi:hypothetical protein